MSRIFRLLTCLLLVLALAAAPTVLASPADQASSLWGTSLSQLWSHVVAAVSGTDDATNRGPEIDPEGTALTNSDDDGGNMGPEIDPDGLTALPLGEGNSGSDNDPDG